MTARQVKLGLGLVNQTETSAKLLTQLLMPRVNTLLQTPHPLRLNSSLKKPRHPPKPELAS